MGDILVQQFNPSSKCWNTLHKINSTEYDEDTFVPINKYNGPYRVLGLDEPKKVLDFSKESVVESVELEETEPEEDGFEFNDEWK